MTSNGNYNSLTSARDQTILLEPGLKQIPRDITTEPLSLEMFNKAASDLNTKEIINLKKYNHYLVKKSIKACLDYVYQSKCPTL